MDLAEKYQVSSGTDLYQICSAVRCVTVAKILFQ